MMWTVLWVILVFGIGFFCGSVWQGWWRGDKDYEP